MAIDNELPLSGVKVVDMTRLIPGAGVTMQLADQGADVIKIERPPGGDYLRLIEPKYRSRGYLHLIMNRNKRSLALDDRTPEGRAILEQLIAEADVFVEANRPGVAAKAGYDDATLRALNPKLVYCSITGFGQTGPYAGVASHGLNIDAFAGVLGVDRSGPKPVVDQQYMSVSAVWGPVFAAMAVGFALLQAERTGRGSYLDASCWEGALQYNFRHLTHMLNDGTGWPAYSTLGSRYDIYITADDQELMVCPIEPKFWTRFCDAVGRPDLAEGGEDVDFGSPALTEQLSAIVAARTLEEWMHIVFEHDLPISPVYNAAQAAEDPHFVARDRVVEVDHPIEGPMKLLAPPVRFGHAAFTATPAPEMGEHTAEILREMGKSDAEIADLCARSIVTTMEVDGQ